MIYLGCKWYPSQLEVDYLDCASCFLEKLFVKILEYLVSYLKPLLKVINCTIQNSCILYRSLGYPQNYFLPSISKLKVIITQVFGFQEIIKTQVDLHI